MKKNFNVIEINGFKGIALAIFLLACLATGFLVFPGWLCMNTWNFIAGYVVDMPRMELLHGSILWAIFALSFYALNSKKFLISFRSAPLPTRAYQDEKLKQIIKQIQEKNAESLQSRTESVVDETQDNNEKIEQ